MTARDRKSESDDFSLIEYSHLDLSEKLLWERSEFIRHPFRLGELNCALRSAATTPKGQRMDFSPVCENTAIDAISIASVDAETADAERAVFLDTYERAIHVLRGDGAGLEHSVLPLPIEHFAYGFFFNQQLLISGSNIDKRIFEMSGNVLVEADADVAERMAGSFRSGTDEVLFMDDARTVLASADYNAGTVTFTVTNAAGESILEHILTP